MILKASGKLREAVLQASPAQLVDYILLSLREQDYATLRMLTNGANLTFPLEDVASVRRVSAFGDEAEADLLTAELPVTVATWAAGKRPQKERWIFTFQRSSVLANWKLSELAKSPQAGERMQKSSPHGPG
jgi:hypothetical protein